MFSRKPSSADIAAVAARILASTPECPSDEPYATCLCPGCCAVKVANAFLDSQTESRCSVEWLKSNWKLIAVMITIVASAFGVVVRIETGPVSKPEINIILPESEPVFEASRSGFHRSFHPIIRAHLARAVAERDRCTFTEAWRKTAKLTSADYDGATIEAAAQTKTPVGQLGDGQLLQKILDWLKSPEGQAFLKLLITLLMAMI